MLREYLESREKEVVDMLMTLFDEEQIIKNHDATIRREEQESTKISSIKNLMKTLKLTAEQAMDALMIPPAEQATLIKKI